MPVKVSSFLGLKSLGNAALGKSSATLFEIRLDNDIIILRGSEDEAASQMLTGTVVLCLPAALKIEDVHLRMTGQLKLGWAEQKITPSGVHTERVGRTTEIFNHRWDPFVGRSGHGQSSRGMTLQAGNYEWPFSVKIEGSNPESVEGMTDSHIIYKLKATVARGKFAYDLHTWKPVRIIRTLDPAAEEITEALTIDNIWTHKIEYQIIVPQKAIIFGTAIPIDMRFTPLVKGLKVGKVQVELVEHQEITIRGVHAHKSRKHQRQVGKWTFEIGDEHYHEALDDSSHDGYIFKEIMPLPKTLSRCLQNMDVRGIKVTHKIHFHVALHNPDGHISELRAVMPLTIFISPNMPLNAEGCLVDQTPMSTESFNIVQHAPPLYGEHVLDQLYADIDQTGYMTPVPQTGVRTPFYSHSMTGSLENLASIAATTESDTLPPAELASRLQSLNLRPRNLVRGFPSSDSEATTPDRRYSGQFSDPQSRRTSAEAEIAATAPTVASRLPTPEHIDYPELGDLNQVPSYNTAVRAPAGRSNHSDGLPNYDTAVLAPTTTPPSPTPRMADTNVLVVGTRQNEGRPGTNRSSIASIGATTPAHQTPPPMSTDAEDRRRLQLLQDRDRGQH